MSAQTHATPEPAVVEDQLKAARRSISDDKGIRWLDPPTRRGEVPQRSASGFLGPSRHHRGPPSPPSGVMSRE